MKQVWLVGFVAFIACTTWAIIPLNNSKAGSFTVELHRPAKQESIPAEQSFDQTVFTANLWSTPPRKNNEEKITKKQAPRAKPLRLQLIGITSDGNTLKAAIYDPDSDQLLIVVNGDAILGRSISQITRNTVEIADGRNTHHLQLIGYVGDKGDDNSW